MRSRNVVSHTSYGHNHDIDLKNISSSDVEAIKSKGFEDDDDDDELKKTNIIVMIKNPRIILCLGILLGVVLSIFIHHIDAKPIQNVHKNVKHVYRAHNEARKEYLKRYREAYLESILSSSANVASKEELNIDVDEIISTAAADIEVENTITVEKEEEESPTASKPATDIEVENIIIEKKEEDEEKKVNSSVASTSDKIIFKTLENGKHVCLPLIPEEFSELVVEEGNDASGALTSRAECEWFNTLTKVGLEAAKMPSTCVPNNHIFATFTNDHDWEMLEFGLQYVKSEKCLIDRLLVLCLDDESFIKCKAAKFEHCVEYIISLGASDFLKDDYKQIVWLKPKMALALLNAKLSLFTLDSDILFFQVPDLAKIVELNPDVELFYQWERVDYKQVYTIPNYNEDYEENIVHDGFNSGQVLWLPTENVIKGILFALLDGKRGAGGGFEQTYSAVGMKKAGVKSAGLSFKYAGNWACKTKSECLVKTNSQNWISYHATWVIGLEEKMEVLKMAKEGWLSLTTKASDIGDKLGVNDNFKGEDKLQTADNLKENSSEPLKLLRDKNVELHILNHFSDAGLGYLMKYDANIYEICEELKIRDVSIHECGMHKKPWHFVYKCPETLAKKNLIEYSNRTSELFKLLGPNDETDDMENFIHVNGQEENWVDILENLNPDKLTKVFLTQPHNKYQADSKYAVIQSRDNSCSIVRKWFGDPSYFILEELKKRLLRGNSQNEIAFHFRLLDQEKLGIEILSDLTIKQGARDITMEEPRLDRGGGYTLLSQLDLKRAVSSLTFFANKLFEISGKTTFVATDSPAVYKYLENFPSISMIKRTDEIADSRELSDSHYSPSSALDIYALSKGKKVVSFPFKSSYSDTASCLGGGVYQSITSVDELEGVFSQYSKV